MPSQEIAYGTHEGNLDTLQGSLSCPWAIEPARSSEIELIPNLNLIKKIKLGRTLDKLIYEAFATIFMSEILKQYSDILRPNDLMIHSPKEAHTLIADEDTIFLALAEGVRGGKNYEKDTFRLSDPLTDESCKLLGK